MSLQEMRLKAGVSQSQLSALSGINYRTLQAYESGRKNVNSAKLKQILKLASALNCTVEEIVNNDDAELMELLKGVKNAR